MKFKMKKNPRWNKAITVLDPSKPGTVHKFIKKGDACEIACDDVFARDLLERWSEYLEICEEQEKPKPKAKPKAKPERNKMMDSKKLDQA